MVYGKSIIEGKNRTVHTHQKVLNSYILELSVKESTSDVRDVGDLVSR